MCGIVGFLNVSSQNTSFPPQQCLEILQRMNQALIHRGPDEDGFFVDGPLSMAMRRLKIIDLSTGKQPIANEDDSVSVVFNGEIYNYKELRTQLISQGHTFKTQSDTEVLVHLYEQEGELFPEKMRGMFVFALWDKKKNRLLLGRDHFGIKPLYWGRFQSQIIFASEIKALYQHPYFSGEMNWDAIDDFLTELFIPTPHTAYSNVHTLEPATVLIFEADGSQRSVRYWNPVEKFLSAQSSVLNNLTDAEAQLESKLSECVNLVMRSDVPLGVFLSSGLDSTTIAHFAKLANPAIRTFTIYFEDKSYSERIEAAAVARHLKTQHTEILLELPKDLPQFIWKVLSGFDQPFGDLSVIPTYLLCQAARQYITVALSGDGGDELFAGYPTTQATVAFEKYLHIPAIFRNKIFPGLVKTIPTSFDRVTWDYKIKRFVLGSMGLSSPQQAHFAWRGAFTWDERQEFYSPDFYQRVRSKMPYQNSVGVFDGMERIDLRDQCLLGDLKANMVDQYLIKADMTSMAHSLELRPALLDPELAELSFRIPFEYKLRHGKTKWILRKLMESKLPPEITKLPKKGFTPPLSSWLREKRFQDFIRDVVRTPAFLAMNVLNVKKIEQLLTEHQSGKVDHTRRLWAIISLATFSAQPKRLN